VVIEGKILRKKDKKHENQKEKKEKFEVKW
jgi:hypothetical protein